MKDPGEFYLVSRMVFRGLVKSCRPESFFPGFISEWRFDFGIFSRNGTSLVSGNMQNITYKLKIRHIKI